MALTERQKRFAFEYVRDFIGGKAAIRAGYAEAGSYDTASRLLANSEIQAEIEEYKAQAARVSRITVAWVLDQWYQIASANPRDLQWVVVHPCPNCWPAAICPDPNPLCETCRGAGLRVTHMADTRKLTGPAARLFAGVKQTKDGIETKFRDQDGALKSIANYLGMEKNQLSGPGGGPIPLQATSDASQLSDEALAAVIASGKNTLQLGVSSGVSSDHQPVTLEGTTT